MANSTQSSPAGETAEREQLTRGATASLRAKVLLMFVLLVIVVALSEGVLRLFFSQSFSTGSDERVLTHHYHHVLGWFPVRSNRRHFTGLRTIRVVHNSQGFRAPEPVASNKPGIIFLGDSLVWGFDVEASERFTERIAATHPEWAVHNFGARDYGTDQDYLLLQQHFDTYKPKVVFLLICGDNDDEDNAWNFRGGYYKPSFTIAKGGLKLNGVPVPRSEKAIFSEHKTLCSPYLVRLFVRVYCKLILPAPKKNPEPPTGAILLDLRKYVNDRGAYFAVGLQQSNAELERFLRQFGIPFVDLTTTNPIHRYPGFGGHWTPAGHELVSQRIAKFLETQ